MKRFALIGGGGFSKEVAEVIALNGDDVVGYFGTEEGELNRPYWGVMENMLQFQDRFDAIALAFGSVDRKSAENRGRVVDWITKQGFSAPPIVSPHAIRAAGVTIADGVFVAHGVVISVDAEVGAFSILNSAAIVGHDAIVGCNVVVAPGAFLGGRVQVGNDSLLGPGTLTLEGRIIGASVIVGVGATVARNIPDGATVMPIRARVLKSNR